MAEEEDPDLAAAIRASLGLPPLVNNSQPLFLPSSDDDEEAQVQDDDEDQEVQIQEDRRSASGSGGSEVPDFSDEEAVDRFFGVLRDQNQAQHPPPPPPPVQQRAERRVPGGWDGVWRGQSRLLDDDNEGGRMEVEQEQEEDGPEYRLALRRSREEEERRIAALRVPELVPDDVDGEDEEEMMRRAIEASMRPVTPPTQSDEIDEEEEDRFNEELRKAIEESRKERERKAGQEGSGGSNSSSATAAASAPVVPSASPAPLFGRVPAPQAQGESNTSSSATLASSSSSSSPPTVVVAQPSPPPSNTQPTAPTSTASSSMFGGLSRAELEKERLARANKRQLTDDGNNASSSSSSSHQPPSKKPRPTNTNARFMTFGDLPTEVDDDDAPSGSGGGAATGSAWGGGGGSARPGGVETIGREERFWDGEKGYGFTTNRLCSEPGKYFGIKELIGDTSTLKQAIISTYCFEPEMVAQLFPTSVPTILISQPPSSDLAGKSHHGSSVDGIWSCYPYLPPWPGGGNGRFRGVCHMKFMLLFYNDGRLRVVIMSANFMNFDFRSIENGVWVQDFHRRTSQEVVKTDFGQQWEMILEALGVTKTFRLINPVHHNLPFQQTADIHRWDFSSVKVRLVASLGGKKEGWKAMEKVGQCRLGKVLREEGWVAGKGRVLKSLEAQGSSLGNYSTKWMNDMFRNASGNDPRTWLGRISKQQDASYPPIKILFPTLETIDGTFAGRNGGGTFFCDEKKWTDKTKHLFYSAEAKRGAVLMHIKILVAIFEPSPLTAASSSSASNSKEKGRAPPPEVINLSGSETEDEDGQPLSLSKPQPTTLSNGKGKEKEVVVPEAVAEKRVSGWVYMGSHNFTPSAWGNLSMRKDGTPGQDGANYELGLLMPLTSDAPQAEADKLVTWKRPAKKYTGKDLPWMQYQHHLEGGHGTGRSD